jgi:hypothetical protein
MNAEQRAVYDDIVSGPRARLVGPLRAALHNPARCCALAPASTRARANWRSWSPRGAGTASSNGISTPLPRKQPACRKR